MISGTACPCLITTQQRLPLFTGLRMENFDLWPQLAALGQVIAIDLVLAGDNAIVVGMAAATVPLEQRRKVIFWGIGAAIALRIFFALITTQLLAIIGLTLAGGVLLLWVCWKMYQIGRASCRERVTIAVVAAG